MKSNITAMTPKTAPLFRLLVLPLLCLALAAPSARAQVEGPPTFIDYQGMVFDGTNIEKPLGSDETTGSYTANPTNYTMEFRIYGSPAGDDLIWAETQTVTVSLGAFSVRLGTGAAIAGSAAGTLTGPAIENAFDGKERYLELTVKAAGQTSTPIRPRLAFQSSPFAFVAGRAVVADSVEGGGTFSGTINATGSTISGGTLSGGRFSGAINATGSTISGGTFSGNGGGLSGLNANNISAGTLNDNRLTNNVARLDREQTWTSTQNFGFITSNSNIYLTEGGLLAKDAILRSEKNVSLSGNGALTIGGSGENMTMDTNEIQARNNGASSRLHLNYRGGDIMLAYGGGNVGIGTQVPTKARLHVYGNRVFETPKFSRYMQFDKGEVTTDSTDNAATSIWASNAIIAERFAAISDARIKCRVGLSDSVRDLATIRGIEVTDYTYIDTVQKGGRSHKKVIAQQVEQLYPQAVSKSTDEIPDIYERAKIKESWIYLDTDLKIGERVKLIGGKKEGIYEVLEVTAGKFRTGFAPEGDNVFVYGREVDDFRTVDYDAIAMLNVSATQELARKLEAKDGEVTALQSENAVLKARLSALEANDKARAAKLAVIEQLLSTGQAVGGTVPASVPVNAVTVTK